MLQIGLDTYASDALEDAMRLAQTKALNSYSWSDCLNFLNYAWMDMYQQIAFVDEGYYSKTVRLTKKLTKLPRCFKNSIKVYAAQQQNMYNREVFRAAGMNDLQGWNTYHISGWDLYCHDAERRTIWLNYVPQQPMIFFPRNNRDPKLYMDLDNLPVKVTDFTQLYNLWEVFLEPALVGAEHYIYCTIGDTPPLRYTVRFRYRNIAANINDVDATAIFERAAGYENILSSVNIEPEWSVHSFICDYPYIFVTYKHVITGEYLSGFYKSLPDDNEFIEYNPFAFTGRNSNVEYLQAKWNDKTGLGVIIYDWNDMYVNDQDPLQILRPRIKELGWTPDSLLVYPGPEMYRLLVARLADKLASLNESEILGVQKELTEAEFAFKQFLGKDKSSWQRIDNVNGPTIGDWL
jgi:hypothetical protein